MRQPGKNAVKTWWVAAVVVVIGLSGWVRSARHNEGVGGGSAVAVYKSPTRGCCGAWVAHLERSGFHVVTHDVADISAVAYVQESPWMS